VDGGIKIRTMISLSLYTYNQIRRMKNEAFERGEKYGRETAIDDLRDAQKYNCTNLTEEEKDTVMKYLIDNNLEFGYNVIEGGFYILKKQK
jgi:hypothetical protein